MLHKAEIKLIRSLDDKKSRSEHGLFVVEGNKIIQELLASYPGGIHTVYASRTWLGNLPQDSLQNINYKFTDAGEMERISFLKTPQQALALLHMNHPEWNHDEISGSISLVLDWIQDPGNLGTIVRIAHWFGISSIICSMDSADICNPKAIQATMGSFMHVKVYYRDLASLLAGFMTTGDFMVYGTFQEGESIYTQPLHNKGFVILGNESRGISSTLHPFIGKRLMIPSFCGPARPDSLNVAMAAAIICSELRRPYPDRMNLNSSDR
ncbi:MAG: RNA methyltransferase [Bacteroidales bacterium]|nr:RNA methyltransferase [Bacteroidales bacterium]